MELGRDLNGILKFFFVFSKHVGRIKRTRNKVLTTHTNKDSDFSTV